MCDDLLPSPRGRYIDLTSVATYMVILGRDKRRVILKLIMPSVERISIEWLSIAINLPDTRYRHCSPSLIVEGKTTKVSRTLIGITHPVETPLTIERKEMLTLMLIHCLLPLLERKESRVHRQPVNGIHLWILPRLFPSTLPHKRETT